LEGLFYFQCNVVAAYTLFVYWYSEYPPIASVGSYMELERSTGGIKTDSQKSRNAVGIKGGLPELKEAYWVGRDLLK
jgi:hypothetical protein